MTLTAPRRPPSSWSVSDRPSGSHRPGLRFGRGPSDTPVTVFLTILTLASAAGLDRVFIGLGWLWPVIVCGVASHATCWAARRWRVSQPLALAAAIVVVILVAVWTVLAHTTLFGLPDGRTWHAVVDGYRQVTRDFTGTVAPVAVTPGFELLCALGAGVVGILADWICFRWRSSLVGATPAFALFIIACTSGQGGGRRWVIAVEVLALLGYLVAHTAFGSGSNVWFAGVRRGVTSWAIGTALITGGAAMVTVLILSPLLSGPDGTGVLGWRAGIGAGGDGERIVSNPIVDLQTRLIQLSDVPVFTVQSPVSSYWRLTSLDTFTGQTWMATASYRGFGSKLPGVGSVPPGTKTVQEQFQIESLDSVWLPSAFNPVAVQGVKDVSFDPGSNSLLTSARTSNGLNYTVTSYEYLSTLTKAQLEAAPPVDVTGALTHDTQLPSGISPIVQALATELTQGQPTEYDKAVAIQDYLRSSRFTYTLKPEFDGSSTDTIFNFLFVTKQGYCQQFAGAFGVLARMAGLPTRLAVGFTQGTNLTADSYQVTDADAHTWPEVYFGPKYGWVPFEPTPGSSDPISNGYAGTGGSSSAATTVPTSPTTVPAGSVPNINRNPGRNTSTNTTPSTVAAATPIHHGARLVSLAIPVVVVVGFFAVWVVGNIGLRRLRWSFRRRRAKLKGGSAEVLADWANVTEVLAWRGVGRAPSETDDEFAVRAIRALDRQLDAPVPELSAGVAQLAGLVREAEFARDVPAEAPGQAAAAAGVVHRHLVRTASRRQVLSWVLLPRPGRRRTPVTI